MDNRAFVSGFAAGMGTMFMLDPLGGRRRRALVRDKAVHYQHRGGNYLKKAGRDLSHRVRGVVAERRTPRRGEEASDAILEARVRSHLGRVTTHSSAIDVRASEGTVLLDGYILANELNDVLDCVASVPGVHKIINRLEVHESPGKIPALQGRGRIPQQRPGRKPGVVLSSVLGVIGASLLVSVFRPKIAAGRAPEVVQAPGGLWNVHLATGEPGAAAA